MQILNLHFSYLLLYFGISLFLLVLFFSFYKRQKSINKQYPAIAKKKYFYVKCIFLLLAFFTIFLSIFGIKIIENTEKNLEGIDIIFVLDVSKSMNVADITDEKYSYTRLHFAKTLISNFVSKNEQNRFGLVIFSGEAVSTIPLTTDSAVFLNLLEHVDYKNLLQQGSEIVKAIKIANYRFDKTEERAKSVIFLSDGGDGFEDISEIYDKNIAYFIAGIGTEEGGKIIKSRDPFGRFQYQKYKGKYVVSKLNSKSLIALSDVLHADYMHMEDVLDLGKFEKNLEKLEKKSILLGNIENAKDLSRSLGFISFFFFFLFFGICIYEKNKN